MCEIREFIVYASSQSQFNEMAIFSHLFTGQSTAGVTMLSATLNFNKLSHLRHTYIHVK